MSDWQPMASAPDDDTVILGLGLPPEPFLGYNGTHIDVRLIKRWCYGNSIGYTARNDHGYFTVGFRPQFWMPYVGPADAISPVSTKPKTGSVRLILSYEDLMQGYDEVLNPPGAPLSDV